MLFIVFSPYNILLGIVLLIFRIGEGLILFYNEKNYWGFRNIARKYSVSSVAEKNSLRDLASSIFKTKNSRFKFAMFCWSIGTLAFSIILATSEVVPQIIGWLGIVASILMCFQYGLKLVKHSSKILNIFSGLFAIIFEVIIGGWLLFSPIL
jgi:hypothetical protein